MEVFSVGKICTKSLTVARQEVALRLNKWMMVGNRAADLVGSKCNLMVRFSFMKKTMLSDYMFSYNSDEGYKNRVHKQRYDCEMSKGQIQIRLGIV